MCKKIFKLSCDWKEMFDFSYIEDCVESLRTNYPNNKIYFYDLETGNDSHDLLISIFEFEKKHNDVLVILSSMNEDDDDFPEGIDLKMVDHYTIENIDEEKILLKDRLKNLLFTNLSNSDESIVINKLSELNRTSYRRAYELIYLKQTIEEIEHKYNEEI